ncbi:UNVERIFIED_CONTAM: long-chain fatty acid-CoA ligase [Siphonaria sp. JEL0065]|nr:long-chain fatty acid-CoA ligase [Siphonaria sp. JEL0065]
MTKKSAPIEGTATAGASAIYRNVETPVLTTTPAEGIATIYDIMKRGFTTMPDREMFGQRRVVNIIEEEKEVIKKVPGGGEVKEMKKWKYFELSSFEWLTFADAQKLSHAYASGYHALGLRTHDKLTVYSETCRDWMLTAMAAAQQSITVTTAYATLGEEGLTYSLQECEITTIFTNADLLPMIIKVFPNAKHLKNVVYNGIPDEKVLEKLKKEFHHFCHLKVLSLDELKTLGEAHLVDPVPPKAEDLALIMYTSGSTGPPKGVMLTHANVVATVSGARNYSLKQLKEDGSEWYIAFLPLAHILEYAVEMTWLFMGIRIGYGSVKTLTDASVRNCKGDIRELRPTVMAGVPAVFEGIRKAVTGRIAGASSVSQAVFNGAFQLKWLFMSYGMDYLAAPLDAIVFNKIKDQVGGRLKFALSGGAPMPKSTQQFLSVTATKTISGYGMTECSAVLAIQDVSNVTALGTTGSPVTSVEVKLVDVENTNYKSTNLPKPQGEIWVRGASVMKGYYKQEQLTRETITEDGWLMTGDIAEMNEDGSLQIIDRKKNLVKLSNGEYIALEKLESNYKVSKFVQNICVHADSEQSYAVALIQPIEKEIRGAAVQLNLYPDTNVEHLELKELTDRKEIRELVLKSLKDVAKSIGLKPSEVVGQVFLSHEEWTPQNGMLTAAMKLQRKDIVKKYKTEITTMYSS